MIMGAPTATVLLMLSSTTRAFVRPVGPAALSGARWSKVNSASQVGDNNAPNPAHVNTTTSAAKLKQASRPWWYGEILQGSRHTYVDMCLVNGREAKFTLHVGEIFGGAINERHTLGVRRAGWSPPFL